MSFDLGATTMTCLMTGGRLLTPEPTDQKATIHTRIMMKKHAGMNIMLSDVW